MRPKYFSKELIEELNKIAAIAAPNNLFTISREVGMSLAFEFPYAVEEVKQITYGPPKIGKRGKVKKW